MAIRIVTVNVSVSAAPAPSILQQTGALISQGATTLASGTYSLLTQASDLTPLLAAAEAITSIAWASNLVTVTTTSPLPVNFVVGLEFATTIAGNTPAGYNGTVMATVTGASTFTYPLTTDPGTATVEGTFTISGELVSMANTFFAQGSQLGIYVLELGAGTVSTEVTALQTFITANPAVFYAYLIPRGWDANSSFLAFLAGYESTTSKTYFFITTTTANYADYTALMKCAVTLIEAPTIPVNEFSIASLIWVALHYNPSGTNRVTPYTFSFVYGVTAYPIFGNNALMAALKAANVNVIGTAAEGGLTNTMISWGTTMDGNDFSYWYSVDWIQINLDLNIANAVINGSNNPTNPLYYNQQGINVLQDVAVATVQTAITDGMANGPVVRSSLDPTDFLVALDAGTFTGDNVVNAVPFLPYTLENPNDYAIGKYSGFTAVYIPSRGFKAIIFNVNVTDFLTQ